MTRRGKSALVFATMALLAVGVAPAANARPTCQNSSQTTICETNGSTSIKVRPGTTAPPANQPVLPWLGRGLPGL